MPAVVRQSRAPAGGIDPLGLAAMLAAAVHACLLFAWQLAPKETAPVLEIERDSVEVALVESAASSPATEAAPEPLPSVASPPPGPPPPTPEPIPLPKRTEMVQLEPPQTTPAPRRAASPQPSIKALRPASRPRSSTVPNVLATGSGGTATAGTSVGGTGVGKAIGKPVYSVRPIPVFPPESRKAGEQGVVLLRLMVNTEGRPTAVNVARSSGFPRLDRAAVEAGWRARVSNAGSGMQFNAPIRFDLRN